MDVNWTKIAPHILDFAYTIPPEQQEQVAQKIRQHYFGEKHINQSTIELMIKVVSDRQYVYDSVKAARLQAQKYKSPVYFYMHGYRATDSFSTYLSNSNTNYGTYVIKV